MKFNRNPRIKSSEIAQHEFCSVGWYLQRCGHKPVSKLLDVGVKAHEKMGTKITSMQTYEQRSRKSMIVGLTLLVIILIIAAWLFL